MAGRLAVGSHPPAAAARFIVDIVLDRRAISWVDSVSIAHRRPGATHVPIGHRLGMRFAHNDTVHAGSPSATEAEMNAEINVNRLAIESVIDGTATLHDVKEILVRAAQLAEDLCLATGHMLPTERGILWLDAKRSVISLRSPRVDVHVDVAHEAQRLRVIAALADEDLAMDPWKRDDF